MRFQDRFHFEIYTDEVLFDESAIIPPMITQPFIENAIEHGQLHTIEEDLFVSHLRKESNMLCISIEDNGIGRKNARANKRGLRTKAWRWTLPVSVSKI